MLKYLFALSLLALIAPAQALDFSNEKPSINIEDARTQCEMGTSEERLAEHRQLGQTILFLKPDWVEKLSEGINANLKHNNKPPKQLDGAALVAMDEAVSQVMIFQFYQGCVVHAVMAPSTLIFGALEKLGIPPDAWE